MACCLRQWLAYVNLLHMRQSPSRTYLLIEERLNGALLDYVTAARDAGKSWHIIAVELHVATNVTVTSETLRIWFHDLEAVSA